MTALAEADIPAEFWEQHRAYQKLQERVRNSPYIPYEPTEAQWAFLLDERREILFGGAAGPGKSVALLMAALLYVDDPRYRALLLRRTYSDLRLPGALIDLADSWLVNTDAVRGANGLQWTFPSGAQLNFGYLANDKQKYRYQSSAFHFVGFDELTQFTKAQYTFMFSRVRRAKSVDLPLRVRAASNPGGVGHEWVKTRFLKARRDWRLFMPARAADNQYLDVVAYRAMLREMDPVSRRQLEHGDWEIAAAGNVFAVDQLSIITAEESATDWANPRVQRCRAWDVAATEKETADWCVGLRLAYDPRTKRYAVEDVVRVRQEPGAVERTMEMTAKLDGPDCTQVLEQEPGSAGKLAVRHLRTTCFNQSPVAVVKPSKDKLMRARLAASRVANGDVEVRPEFWAPSFVNELRAFPQDGINDDQVDAFAYAVHKHAGLIGVAAPVAPSGTIAEGAAAPKRTVQGQTRINRTGTGGRPMAGRSVTGASSIYGRKFR